MYMSPVYFFNKTIIWASWTSSMTLVQLIKRYSIFIKKKIFRKYKMYICNNTIFYLNEVEKQNTSSSIYKVASFIKNQDRRFFDIWQTNMNKDPTQFSRNTGSEVTFHCCWTVITVCQALSRINTSANQ